MTSNLIGVHRGQHYSTVVVFNGFGKTLSIEVQDIIPDEYLERVVRQHIADHVWSQVFEKYITDLSAEAAKSIINTRNLGDPK
jgi:hypothetical protein